MQLGEKLFSDQNLSLNRTQSCATCHDPDYAFIDGVKSCEFELHLGGLLKKGENKLAFRSEAGMWNNPAETIVLGDMELRIGPSVSGFLAAAPTGELAIYEPQASFRKSYSKVASKGDAITVAVNGEEFKVKSRFSAPDGKWYYGTNKFYKHTRTIIEHDEWIEVKDTFENLTDENIPIMQLHSCDLRESIRGAWVCGSPIPNRTAQKQYGENPTVFATTVQSGIGILALNDEFRVHCHEKVDDTKIELSDPWFVLKAKGEYTAEWAVVPVAKPDFWAFINAVRRFMKSNFPIDTTFAFLHGPEPLYEWSDEKLKEYIDDKSADFVVKGIFIDGYKGRLPHGTAFQLSPLEDYIEFVNRIKKLYPDGSVTPAIYYCAYIDAGPEPEKRYPDAVMLDSKGSVLAYRTHTDLKMMIPTLENSYGRVTSINMDIIMDTIGAAIYWDEFTWSAGQYTYGQWDGCSADIDLKTLQISKLKGSMSLMSRDFRSHHVNRIMDRGVKLWCNGAPVTRTLARLKYYGFAETGNAFYSRSVLLHTPVALGDHMTERTEDDAYRSILDALDNGCVYAWYGTNVIPTHKTLTEYMYPFTPIEIHSGYLIGKERILTNRSGLFCWGDHSDFTAHVFDSTGRETTKIKIPSLTRNNKTFAQVRIPQGYSVSIVRVGASE